MHSDRLAAGLGAVACLLTVVAVAAPFVAVGDGVVVTSYYGTGAVSPLAVGLVALVGVVAFAAGAEDRSDPSVVAGLTLVLGTTSLLIALQWALSFGRLPLGLAGESTYDFLSTHRWTVVVATALWTAAAVWYADALGLLSGSRGG